MTKLLQVTISGSFMLNHEDTESYGDIVGLVPMIDGDKVSQMVIKRYAAMWLRNAKKEDGTPLFRSVRRVREVFIDSVDEVDAKPLSYVGKDIMTLSFEELQDLAAAKDLGAIPLYKVGSLAVQRRKAFAEYSTKVLDVPLDVNEEGFSPAKHPKIICDDKTRRSADYVADIEETIDREALALKGKAPATSTRGLSMEQLKEVADMKKIAYHAKISYEELYKKIYGKAA